MLPWLEKKRMASTIMDNRSSKPAEEKSEQSPDLMQCAQALLSAIEAKDVEAVAQALQSLKEHS